MRVLRISFPTTVVRVDEPTVSMPSQRARRIVLPMIAASTPPRPDASLVRPALRGRVRLGGAPVAGRVADVGDDVVESEAVQRRGGAAVLLLREQDAVRAEASNPRSDNAHVARPVRAESEDARLGASVAFDQRVLDRHVGERAPDVHAVRAHTCETQPAEPHVSGAVEHGDSYAPAGAGPATVDREVRDRDVAALCDQQREVRRAGRSGDDRLRPRPEEPRAVSELRVVQLIAPGGQANGDATVAKGGERPGEAILRSGGQGFRPEPFRRESDRCRRSAPSQAVDGGGPKPMATRPYESRVKELRVRSHSVRAERYSVQEKRDGHHAARTCPGGCLQRGRAIDGAGRCEELDRRRRAGGGREEGGSWPENETAHCGRSAERLRESPVPPQPAMQGPSPPTSRPTSSSSGGPREGAAPCAERYRQKPWRTEEC